MPAFYWIKKILFIMNRKLLFLERLLYGNGTTPFNGTFAVKIRGSITTENLRRALAKLQAKHPMLRAGVQEDQSGIPWFVENKNVPEIPLRVVERYTDDDWMRASISEWATMFDLRNGPLLRIVWLRSAEVSDLILCGHHCVIDGGSVLLLAHDILAFLDDPDKDIGTYAAFTSIREIVPAAKWHNKKTILKKKLAAGISQLLLPVIAAIMSMKHKAPLSRENDYLLHWKLDKTTTAALVRRCATAGISAHSALCVAFLSAWQQVLGKDAYNKVICPVDIRRYIREIKKDEIFSFGLSISLTMDLAGSKDFWVQAKNIHTLLSAKAAQLNGYEQLMNFEYLHGSAKALMKCLTHGRAKYDLMFSNLGRMDIPKRYHAFEVESVYSPTVIGPYGNPNTILASTFRGEMGFSFISNEGFLAYDKAVVIKEMAMGLLLKELVEEPQIAATA
jgi:NRPS condensation-like uncharacterized protein